MNYDFNKIRKKLAQYGEIREERGIEYFIVGDKKIPIPRTS
jgi:hypothetical protein